MIRILFGLLLTAASSAHAAELRKPTARWVVNYDDAQCVASRDYGTEEKPLFLAFKPSATGSVMRILMVRNGGSSIAEQSPGTLRFDDNRAIPVRALSYGDGGTKKYMTSINVPMTTFTSNRQATKITIKGGRFNEQLSVPGLSGVAAAFDDCLANLRDVWNVGEQYSARLTQAAQPAQPLGSLFTAKSYPAQAIHEDNTGIVEIRMLIDEAGKVRDCMIEKTSGYATLDTMSCYVITTKGKFTAAVGADGKPAKSALFQRITWRIAP
jgi:TonB family protein